jgi:hypothetical protein
VQLHAEPQVTSGFDAPAHDPSQFWGPQLTPVPLHESAAVEHCHRQRPVPHSMTAFLQLDASTQMVRQT